MDVNVSLKVTTCPNVLAVSNSTKQISRVFRNAVSDVHGPFGLSGGVHVCKAAPVKNITECMKTSAFCL